MSSTKIDNRYAASYGQSSPGSDLTQLQALATTNAQAQRASNTFYQNSAQQEEYCRCFLCHMSKEINFDFGCERTLSSPMVGKGCEGWESD